MAENDKFLWQIDETSTINDEDRLLVVVGTSERLITKENFLKVLNGGSSNELISNFDPNQFIEENGIIKIRGYENLISANADLENVLNGGV